MPWLSAKHPPGSGGALVRLYQPILPGLVCGISTDYPCSKEAELVNSLYLVARQITFVNPYGCSALSFVIGQIFLRPQAL